VRTYSSLTIKGENVGGNILGDPQNLENKWECSKSHKNRLKWNKSEINKYEIMQREANGDPFFTRLDRRHNPVMVVTPDLSTHYIKRDVRHHAVSQRSSWETLAPTFFVTDRVPASVWRPPPTASYPTHVPGQCRYMPQGRTDLLRWQTQEAKTRLTTFMADELSLGHGMSSWCAFISVLDLVWRSLCLCLCHAVYTLLSTASPESNIHSSASIVLIE
jgi:hypothetical protein